MITLSDSGTRDETEGKRRNDLLEKIALQLKRLVVGTSILAELDLEKQIRK